MILLLAAPAAAAARQPAPPRELFDVSPPAAPVRDAVIGKPGAASARIAASAASERYPVDDGSGVTIAVSVTPACAAACTAADPQQIAGFIGALIHGEEIGLLTVQLDTPFQLGFDCGFGAEACYYSGENRIVISGDDSPAADGASRDYILAHEYGHHVAQHRESPAPFTPAIDWGTARWASYEHVCQGRRAGALFPGDEGTHYYEDPGEAFAESFARYRFPDTQLKWGWIPRLRPSAGAFQAIREDTLSPWRGRESFVLRGHVPARGKGAAVESLRTPLDGMVSLRPSGLRRHGYELALRSRAGKLLRTSHHGLGPHHQLDYTVCGQSRLRLVIKSTRPSGGPFKLMIQRP